MNSKVKAVLEALKFLTKFLRCRSKCCSGSECVCGDTIFDRVRSQQKLAEMEDVSTESHELKCENIVEL
jgi:hypothetical protein